MNQEENEVSINLGDMFAHILHHWKMILIMALILMAGVGGFMSYRDYIGLKTKYAEETYSSMIANLTDAQLSNVNQFYNKYKNYKDRIVDNEFYLDNSLRMKIDPNNVSVYTVEYLIKTGYQGIMDSFAAATLDLDDYEKMAEVYGGDVDARYVNELVDIWGSVQQNSYDIDTDKVGDVINGNISNTYTGILTFRVTSNSKETCEKVAEIADAAIMEHMDKLKSVGIEAEISPLTNAYTEKVDSSLAEYQRAQIDTGSDLVSGYYSFVASAEKSLDEDEVAVFKYLIDKDEEVIEHVHWKKYIVIGFVAGLVIAIVILVIRYLLIPGIKTSDDAYLLTKEKEMGIVIQAPTSKLFLGKLFHNWARKVEFHGVKQLPDTQSIPLICDRVAKSCKDKSAESVFLISDVDNGYTKEVVDKCLKLLTENGLNVKAGNPIASVEDLKSLRESKAAVLVLTDKGSLPDSVRGNKAVCEENQVAIIGDFIVHPQR